MKKKKQGYLIFTTHDGDELDARFTDNKEFFNELKSCENNDAAIQVLEKWHDKLDDSEKWWYVMTLGRTICEWPFNDVEVLDTYYFQVY